MKRLLLEILLPALLCLSLAACGGAEQAKAPAPLAEGAGSAGAGPAAEPETPGSPDGPASPAETSSWPDGVPEPSALPVSQTVEGWTLALTRAEGDKYGALFTLELTAPEGAVLDADNYFLDCSPFLEGGSVGGGFGVNMKEDGDKTDNRISFVVDFSGNEDLRGARGVLEAGSLKEIHWSDGHKNDTVTPLTSARWRLPFQIESREDTLAYQPGQRVETSRGTLTVDRVEAGPFSVSMEISGPNVADIRLEQELDIPPRAGTVTFRFLDKNGEPLALSGSMTSPKGTDSMTLVSTFSRRAVPIDPADVAVLVIGGTRIPLE